MNVEYLLAQEQRGPSSRPHPGGVDGCTRTKCLFLDIRIWGRGKDALGHEGEILGDERVVGERDRRK